MCSSAVCYSAIEPYINDGYALENHVRIWFQPPLYTDTDTDMQ